MKILKVILATIISFTLIGNVYAISKEKHKLITNEAVEVYAQCIKELGVKDTLAAGLNLIAEASKSEDESRFFQRYFNWHFYDAYKDDTEHSMGRALTGPRKSLHSIYNKRIDSLVESLVNKNNNDIYEYSGRLVHFIQDMTVPAHVAPIYHYKFLWMGNPDYFDSMPEWGTAKYIKPEKLCSIDISVIPNLKVYAKNILDKTAKNTRDNILEKIPVPTGHDLDGKTWEEFWTLRNHKNDNADSYSGIKYGFAPYGNQGMNGFKKFCENDKEVCLGFFQKSFNTAITSTVKFLLSINAINSHQ